MRIQPKRIFIAAALLALLALCIASEALPLEDGFSSAKRAEGKYFIVYRMSVVEPGALIRALDIAPADKLLAGQAIGKDFSYSDEELTDSLDALFLAVSDILDMRIYSLKINLKVCATQAQLNNLYYNFFGSELSGRFSFYVLATNTIYICAENFTPGVIGHETAHALINHFFVVAPPIKVQEVLSMYVEYQLRKK